MRVFRAGSVFDGEVLRQDTELVVGDDGRVVELRRVQPPPDHVDVVDHGRGTTLLPGLVDGHQHLSWGCTPNVLDGLPADRAAQQAQTVANAGRALAAGVTTIQDLGDSDYVVVDVRDSVNADRHLPRLLASGPPITSVGGHCHFLVGAETAPQDMAAAVRRRVERGVDVIKVMMSGGNITPGSLPWESQFDSAALHALMTAAHAEGIRVAAHAHGAEAARICVEAGVDTIEHCTLMTADGVFHDPRLLHDLSKSGVMVRITPGSVPGGPPPPPALAARMAQIVQGLKLLSEWGIPVVVSTDAGIGPGKPHNSMAYSLIEFGSATGDPILALRAGTALAADALGLTNTCGRLAPGRVADLLAVRGDAATDLGGLLEVDAVYRDGEKVAGSSSRPRPSI